MFLFLLRRIALAVPLLVATSLLIFGIFHFSNIDPVARALGERSQNPALVQQLRTELGLNDPMPVQYWRFIKGAAVGDFGKSMRTRQPVAHEIRKRFPATVELGMTAFAISLVLGLTAGVVSALRKNSWLDYGAMTLSLLAVSLPVFFLALLISWFFSEKLGWFPTDQRLGVQYMEAVPTRTGLLLVDSLLARNGAVFLDALWHLVLPATTLALVSMALVARMTRSSVLEVLRMDFVRTARAKGLGPWRCLYHVMRNAMVPVVTIVGFEIPAMLGGAVITETIFAWPGVGSYLIEAILFADLPAVQGMVLFLTMIFIGVNIAVDVLYAWLDPRLQLGGG